MIRAIELDNGMLALNFPKTTERTDHRVQFNTNNYVEYVQYHKVLNILKTNNMKHRVVQLTNNTETDCIVMIIF